MVMRKRYSDEFRRDVVAVTRWGDRTVLEVNTDFEVSKEMVRD